VTPRRDHFYPGTEPLAADEIRVTAPGTGRPFLRRAQAHTSLLVGLGNGEILMMDFGSGSQMTLAALEIPGEDIIAHTARQDVGPAFTECQPRHAVIHHVFNDFDTAPGTEADVPKKSDERLTFVRDLMAWNVTKGQVDVRMAVVPDHVAVVPDHVCPSTALHEAFRSAALAERPKVSECL